MNLCNLIKIQKHTKNVLKDDGLYSCYLPLVYKIHTLQKRTDFADMFIIKILTAY